MSTRWTVAVILLVLAPSLAPASDLPRLDPVIRIIEGTETSVKYERRLATKVALDPMRRLFHQKGCDLITTEMKWLVPAAATLRGFAPDPKCKALAHTKYETLSIARLPHDPAKIDLLYIGNSLTYYNDMPRMTMEIAAREKTPLEVEQVTISGATLEDLWMRTAALEKLWSKHWDYVVIQERGGVAPFERGDAFERWAKRWADEIRKSGAKPMLFMTWITKDHRKHEELFGRVGREAQLELVPVASAWKSLLDARTFARLDWDGSHPNLAGSYLIATTVFAKIYGKSPSGLPFVFNYQNPNREAHLNPVSTQRLTAAEARAIQNAAWRAVSGR